MGYRARRRNGLRREIDWNAKLLADFDKSVENPPVELLAILDEFRPDDKANSQARRAA